MYGKVDMSDKSVLGRRLARDYRAVKTYVEWSEDKTGTIRSSQDQDLGSPDEPTAFVRFGEGTGHMRFPLTALIQIEG